MKNLQSEAEKTLFQYVFSLYHGKFDDLKGDLLGRIERKPYIYNIKGNAEELLAAASKLERKIRDFERKNPQTPLHPNIIKVSDWRKALKELRAEKRIKRKAKP